MIGFSLTAWANERDSGSRKIKFQAGMLYMPSPKLRFNKTKVSGTYSILDDSEEANYYEGVSQSKFDSVLGIRLAVLYPLNLLENESWVSFSGDLYLESSAKERSEDTISPRFVFANFRIWQNKFIFFGSRSGRYRF